ncbi:MAG: hypothetical protein KA020_01150 [Planctomycetes bacterium]|nr:hypothetical protein [Planctomycetota bacterium]MCC7064572.1 hypothetical protein [Planctomycetota bacterium]
MRLALAVLGFLTSSALAQAVKWQLPERGGAVYKRTLKAEAKVEPAGAESPDIWRGPDQPGTVLAGELDAGRQRRALAVWDLRELIAQLGLDLGSLRAGKSRLDITTANLFQPVRVDVVYGAPAENGQQTFEATIDLDAKAARVEGIPADRPQLKGRVVGSRTVDRTLGLVTRIEGTADLTLDVPERQDGNRKVPACRKIFRITDAWSEPLLLSAESPEFKTRVVNAIRTSMKFLHDRVKERLEQPFDAGPDPYHDIQPGELALMLLALRHAGLDLSDPVLKRGYEILRKRTIEGTYSLSVAILALEALYTPAGEWAELHSGRIKTPMARVLPPEDLAIMRDWAKSLLDNIDTSVDAAYLRRWFYGPAKDYDNSNTQYALLGLYGAQLCGIEISPQIWTAGANHWLQCSIASGQPDFPDLLFQKDVEKGTRTRTGSNKVQARGWGYRADTPTGSMTAAGISGLTLCNAGLRQQKKGTPKLLGEMDDAVRGGFLWLDREFSVRRNPGPPDSWAHWQHYYLYGLERACELNQVARLGGRDWYFEGAMQLLATQNQDGSWGGWHETAFGLLFLKKSALPAMTGR